VTPSFKEEGLLWIKKDYGGRRTYGSLKEEPTLKRDYNKEG